MRQLTTCLVALTALAACGDETPSPTEVRTAIHGDLSHVLTEAKAASDGTTAKLPNSAVFESFFNSEAPALPSRFDHLLDRIGDIDASREPQFAQLLDRFNKIDSKTALRTAADGEQDSFDPEAITKLLEEQVFTDANHLGNGIYRVPASLVCEAPVDPMCVADFDKAQLRVRVASDDDALVFYVQVDANHDEPLSVSLSHDRLAVTLNLDEANDAMVALGEAQTSAKLSGAVTGSLTILGAAHAKLAVDIDRAISVQLDEMKLASAASHLLAIDLDGKASKAALSLGLGETTAHIPGDELDPQARDYDLAGLSLDASFDGTTLALSNLSLGNKTSTVKVAGQNALAIDLNRNDGRKLSATLANDTLSVSPRFDLEIAQNHTLLGDEMPPFDITRVQLDGSLRANEETGSLQVVSGSFSMTTNPAQYGFSATAGQCVSSFGDGFSVEPCN